MKAMLERSMGITLTRLVDECLEFFSQLHCAHSVLDLLVELTILFLHRIPVGHRHEYVFHDRETEEKRLIEDFKNRSLTVG
jgi:hypothetical protein